MNSIKKKFFLALSLFFVITILTVFMIWKFLFAQLYLAQNDYRSNSINLSEIEQKADLRNDLKKELEKINPEVSAVEDTLLSPDDKLEFIQQVENIAASSGNEYYVKSVKEIKNSETNKSEEIDFAVGLEGSFKGVYVFLQGIKSMPYIVNIIQVNIKTQEDSSVTTDIVFKIYLK